MDIAHRRNPTATVAASHPSRLRVASAAAVLAATTVTAACSPMDETATDSSIPTPPPGHVHGLGVDPADNTLYVASHGGVFAVHDDRLKLVADRAQDTMGFTVVGPGHFLASGHPDLRDTDLPGQLGLIESRDAARTWTERSLGGEADLHAIDRGTSIVAYDAGSSQVLASDDAETWRVLWRGGAIDIAARTRTDDLLATTPTGQLLLIRPGADARPISGAPALELVDGAAEDVVVGVDARGQVWRSDDAGRGWAMVGEPLGSPQALDATADRWHVATADAVWSSTDGGDTWSRVVGLGS